jgi:Kef-type K+ transport system membrane component KefB
MRVLVLLAIVGLMTAARSFEVAGDSIGSATALAVGFLLLAAYMTGWIAKQLGMPKLTGYLAAGLVAGDSVMALIPEAASGDLKIFTGVAVSLIALTAGTELELKTMRPLMRTVAWLTGIAGIGTVVILTVAVWLLRAQLPFMQGLSPAGAVAMAAVLGVVMSANSPAVVVALRTEMAADGPLCRTVLGAVVMGDLLVIILFAAVGSAAAPFLGSESDQGALVHLAWHIGGSLVVGAVLAGLLYVFLRLVAASRALFVVAISFVVAEVGARIGLDPLLVALSAGILVRNATRFGDELHEAIEGSSLPVYLVFFAAAGASIHLDVLAVVGVPALLFVVIRALSYLGASRLATQIAGSDPVVKRFVGIGLLPQAGLALALGLLMVKTFPSVGQAAGTLVLGVVALNEMIMPIVYRFALIRAGEAGRATSAGHSAAFPVVPASESTSQTMLAHMNESSQNMIAEQPEEDLASMSLDPRVAQVRGPRSSV